MHPVGLLRGILAARWGLRSLFYAGVVVWGVMFFVTLPIINNRRIAELEAHAEAEAATAE